MIKRTLLGNFFDSKNADIGTPKYISGISSIEEMRHSKFDVTQ